MDFHQLYVFTKVVEHRSFSRAADDIFLSQSTVSSHISSLEKMLNIHLFDRVGREIILTPQGERLYYWAQQILLLKDQAMLDLNQEMTAFRGKIRVAVSSVPGQFILPKLVKKFREEYSQVTFHIKQYSSKLVAEKVINGFVDFGILGERYENDRLHYIPLLKEKLVLITSAQANFNSPIQLQDIIHYPIIMRNAGSGTNAMLERFLKKQQIAKDKLNIIAYTDDSQSLIQYVIQNIGISIISEIAAKGYADNQLLNMYEIPEFNDERYFYLIYNKQKTLPLISKTFIEQAPQWLD
ncbi:LysR family transcriptional regulator [Bacillus sp. DNRA2]|uniref:selenium metabolism-associated LysR family transcriptional regulator n=1 Tax=Bacillus sp. DNRA2 TaxID=2723053 RepID=UPI00145D3328|nr:selenium metabolism-associated LysR family transcriptional regulator [Bacillus sp. DNRA2]NMD71371.1 LysR family transcriptional regulator [Bacillus sp. DNRA2]